MKRAAIGALGGAAAIGMLIPVGVATAADADPAGFRFQAHQELGLTVIPCDTCVLNPIGFNPGDHIGEFLVNRGTLTDATGKTIGHYAMHIVGTTVARGGPPEVELNGTLSLPGGQITVQGLEEPPSDGGTVAVTGGTGKYRSAKGEMRFHDTNETTTDITLIVR
jgi:hypothetical protein